MNLLEKWRYYTFSREEVASCKDALMRHNMFSLSFASIAIAIIMLTLSFYPRNGVVGTHPVLNTVYYSCALSELVVFVLSRIVYLRLKGAATIGRMRVTWQPNALMTFSFTILVFFCFFVQFIDDASVVAIRFLIFFASVQVLFTTSVVLNVTLNISVVIIFTVLKALFHPMPEWIFETLNLILASLISMILMWIISYTIIKDNLLQRAIEVDRDRFYEDSIHDQLTGLFNRRSLDESMQFYLNVCVRVHQTVCVIMADVDYFKLYNDCYGHPKGDDVLVAIGDVMTDMAEKEGMYVARVGGEEFIVLWNENRVAEAEKVALRIRERIHALNIPHEPSPLAPFVTMSLGLYIMRGGTESTAMELYNNVDKALYEAKARGRDCIVEYDSATQEMTTVALVPASEAGRSNRPGGPENREV